jgi:fumagillin biosynthesis dioxygenase
VPKTYDPRHRVFLEPSPHLGVASFFAGDVGLAVLTGVLGGEELSRVRAAVWHAVASQSEAGARAADQSAVEVRVPNLVLEDPVFRELLEHPAALELATKLLGPKIRLSDYHAGIPGPGMAATPLYAAQGYVTPPWPVWPMSVEIIWAIDAFTAENGAPRVMPDSNRYGHGPEWDLPYPETVPLICPAGSIIVMSGKIWRHTGPNTTNKAQRIGLFANYIRPYIVPQTDWRSVVPPPLTTSLTPGLHEMLGFGSQATRHTLTRHGTQVWLNEPANADVTLSER